MGALGREDAWSIAWYRGTLSSNLKNIAPDLDGSMMAVGLAPEKAAEWIAQVTDGHLVVACINSPTSVTISGDTAAIDQLLQMLKINNIFARKLLVDTAYHSPHMHTIAQEYYEWLAEMVPQRPRGGCTMHSSVTGKAIEAPQLNAVNWVRNLTSPVRFSEAIYDMLRPMKDGKRAEQNAVDVLVEIGPHSALQGPTTQTLSAHKITNVPYYSAILRNQDAVTTALQLAGTLWSRGYDVDIQNINTREGDRVVPALTDLPTYPWKHATSYYHEARVEREYLFRPMPRLSLLGAPAPSLRQRERIWRRFIKLAEEPWLADHKIQNTILYPGAGYIAMVIEAACQTADQTKTITSYKLRDIQLMAAAIIAEDQDLECIVQLRPHLIATRDALSTWTEFSVTTSPDGKSLVTNCSGLLLIEYDTGPNSEASQERVLELQDLRIRYANAQEACLDPLDADEMYKDFCTVGLEYGSTFANVREVHYGDSVAHGTIEIPEVQSRILDGHERPHVIHPGTLDAIFHLAFASVMNEKTLTAMVPKFIAEVTVAADIPWKPATILTGVCSSEQHGLRDLISEIGMLYTDLEGEYASAVEIKGLVLTKVDGVSAEITQDGKRSIATKHVWRPALDLLSTEALHRILEPLGDFARLMKVRQLLQYHCLYMLMMPVPQAHTSLKSRRFRPRVCIT
jgi:zearalenone synthase (highly reducing iterative type I polyketide synthase)